MVSNYNSLALSLVRGRSCIYNFSIGSHPQMFTEDEGLFLEDVAPLSFSRIVHVGANCDDLLPNYMERSESQSLARQQSPSRSLFDERDNEYNDITALTTGNAFTILPTSAALSYVAQLKESGAAQLLIYDVKGILLTQLVFPEDTSSRTCYFTLPHKGVYIIKAVTHSNEYTYKIIAN